MARLPHRLREAVSGLPVRLRQWRADIRDDPWIIWRSPATRIGIWCALGLVLILIIQAGIDWTRPADVKQHLDKATPWTTLFVSCANPLCRHSFTAHTAMDFRNWPMSCEKCGARSVYRATRCTRCGQWYALAPGQGPGCPNCAERDAREKAGREQAKPMERPANPDDAEDGY